MRTMLRRDAVLLSPMCNQSASVLCTQQELSFGVIYTAGAWSNQAGRLVIGLVLDHYGPRITGLSSALSFAGGAAVFAVSTTSSAGLTIGYFLIGAGGAGIQLSVQSVAALFPRNRSLVMASLSGAFQFASGAFLVFELLHRQGALLQTMLLFHCVVAVCVGGVLYAALPDKPFGIAHARTSRSYCAARKVPDSPESPRPHEANPRPHLEPAGDLEKPSSGAPRALRSSSFRQQALSAECLLMLTFFAIGALQCQFTVATVGLQFERKGDMDAAATRYFGTCMALVFLWTPALGILIDRVGFGFVLMLVNSLLLLSTLSLLVPSLGLVYATSLIYSLGRVSLWALYFSYNAHVFGFRHFGKIGELLFWSGLEPGPSHPASSLTIQVRMPAVGCGMTLAACLSLLQYPLLQLTIVVLDGDFLFANAILAGLHCAAFATLPHLIRGAREATRAAAAPVTSEPRDTLPLPLPTGSAEVQPQIIKA